MAEAVLITLATAIAESIATEIAKPGVSCALQQIKLLCGVEGELKSLKETVETIQAVLLDAEKQQWHNNEVKVWLGKLKDVLYDVQDLLDNVSTEDLRRKVTSDNKISKEVRVFFSKSNQLAHRLEVANKIKELRKTLDRIEKDKEFHLEKHQSEEQMVIRKGKKPEVSSPDEQIIGRNGDKEKIKQLLFGSSSSVVSSVSIVGKGGLGKTALARLVFHDGEVEKHFDLKMWVCHGDPEIFDVDLIVREILKFAKDECQGDPEMMRNLQEIENKTKEQLLRVLGKVLDKKKYLLVLDDLWNEDRMNWLELGDWLKGGMQGSKILVTTRSHTAAKITDKNSAIHDLKGLPRDESWDLFREVAFGDRQALVDQRMEEMGQSIVRKCAGVPLAIRTIGSLLYGQKEDQWNRYNVNELPEIPEIDAVDNGIMKLLQFSYDHLPSCEKHCFAYCSLFPKDYVYHKEMMIHLWVAQGFIVPLNGEDNLEEVANICLSNLQYRSFLDAITVGDDGEVLTFKMHDLMHDLARKVAGAECKIVDFKEKGIDGRTRHASFISAVSSDEIASKLRTFFYLRGDGFKKESSVLEKVFLGLRHCRVLGLGKLDIRLPPSSFEKSKHLRFLDLSENKSIESLPGSITDLVNLQTLKVSNCVNLATLPKDLRKLVNLRHLLIDGCDSLSHMPRGLNHLSLLRTLSQFIVQRMDHEVHGSVGCLDELDGLNKLAGSMALEKLGCFQPAPDKGHLREKQHLRTLELVWSREERDDKNESNESIMWENLRPHPNLASLTIYHCMSRSPPSWLSSITNLVELALENCGKWTYLPRLGKLPSLRRLSLFRLEALEFVEDIGVPDQFNTARPFYPSLEKLRLIKCTHLEGWWKARQLMGAKQDHWHYDSRSSFPKLMCVSIAECSLLNSMPLFPQIETLDLREGSMKWLEQQLMAVPNYLSKPAVPTFIPLSKLKRLQFYGVVDLEHSMLESIFPIFTNLESLGFYSCDNLRSLSHGMQSLSSLQRLDIAACKELDLWSHDDKHGTQWRSLVKLRDLRISKLPKLVALPRGIQYITTLESLRVEWCNNLMSLPEWISNATSLKKLTITGCSGLTYLPDRMRRFVSMKWRIIECPTLEEWCQRESSADREKIAHLPS